MLAKRIIPCLDVNAGRVVKGTNFIDLKDAGDPVEIAQRYNDQGADEIVFLDITASADNRETIFDVVSQVASQVFIPLTVGGGVRRVSDVRKLLMMGADKVSINSSAIQDPSLINEIAQKVGRQCLVVAIDAKSAHDGRWEVYTHGGRRNTGIDVLQWAKEAEARGAGEILLTSMDADGTKNGFDLTLTRTISNAVGIPVIASGGVGSLTHLAEGITQGGAAAVLAASIFHFGQYRIQEAKDYFRQCQILVR